jgi:hypothetical protein
MSSKLNKIWILSLAGYLCQSFKTKTNLKMKKVLVAVAVVAFFASCKKDYTCDCTTAGVTESTPIKDAKKADAQDACDALGAIYSLGGGSCELN